MITWNVKVKYNPSLGASMLGWGTGMGISYWDLPEESLQGATVAVTFPNVGSFGTLFWEDLYENQVPILRDVDLVDGSYLDLDLTQSPPKATWTRGGLVPPPPAGDDVFSNLQAVYR